VNFKSHEIVLHEFSSESLTISRIQYRLIKAN